MNLYTDNDPFCCQWLRNLVAAGLLPPGDVLERDIREITAEDVVGYTQQHYFCGIAGWPRALQLAGWPADRPVVSASLPCQPWSSAGRQAGAGDERHLWPAFLRLVRQCRPECILGEQVAGAIRLGWLDGVRLDLEAEGYAFGAAVLPAAGAGAPHERHRIFWVARRVDLGVFHPEVDGRRQGGEKRQRGGNRIHAQARNGDGSADAGQSVTLGDANGRSRRRGASEQPREGTRAAEDPQQPRRHGDPGSLAHDDGPGRSECPQPDGEANGRGKQPSRRRDAGRRRGDGSLGDAQRQRVQRKRRRADGEAPPGVQGEDGERERLRADAGTASSVAGRRLDDADAAGREGLPDDLPSGGEIGHERRADGPAGRAGAKTGVALGHTSSGRRNRRPARAGGSREDGPQVAQEAATVGLPTRPEGSGGAGFWDDFILIGCRDGKVRRGSPEPGAFPLAASVPARVGSLLARLEGMGIDPAGARRLVRLARRNRTGRLRGYGNSIVPEVAALFIRAFLEAEKEMT